MAKYKLTAYVGFDSYSTIIEAKNSREANQRALDFGHRKSNYGEKYLRSVKAVRVINQKK